MSKIKVLIADDDPGLRSALADTVRSAPDLELTGMAGNVEETVRLVAEQPPAVILMDVRMPGGGGVVATRAVLAKFPDIKVVTLSAHEDQVTALEMIDAGAIAYIVKGTSELEILEAIRRARRAQMSMPAELGAAAFRDLLRKVREGLDTIQVLRKTDERRLALLEAVPDAVLILNTDGAIQLVNSQTERLFGYRRSELAGQPSEILLPERHRHIYAAYRGKYNAKPLGSPIDSGLRLSGRRRDGTEFPVDISLAPMPAEAGVQVVATIRDATGQTAGEEARRKDEQLFRGLVESAPDAMVIVDSYGAIQLVNAQTERLFGYLVEELRGQSVDILVPERFRQVHVGNRLRYVAQPKARPMGVGLELFGRRKDGSEFPVDIGISPLETEDGTLTIATVRDATDRKEAEKKMEASAERARRQRLFSGLVAAQEAERLHIAGDIHDDTIQAMTATSLRLQQLRRHLSDEEQTALLEKVLEAVQESIVRLRRLMFDLRPASLDHAGLASALRELLERFQEESHITFDLEDHLASELSPDVRTALYRIAQEALANVKRHSTAASVRVELREVDGGCRVRVSDDGTGFAVDETASQPGHLGLISMRERAEIAGGWWTVQCPPGGGTVVEFWLPLTMQSRPDAPPRSSG